MWGAGAGGAQEGFMQGHETPRHSGPTTAEGKDVLTAPQNLPGKAP